MSETTVAARLGGALVDALGADVGQAREQARRRRLALLAAVLAVPAAFLWWRIAVGAPFDVFALPDLPRDPYLYMLPLFLVVILVVIVAMPLASGRSPHMLFRPEQIDVGFGDVKGLDTVVDEVVKTLNTFLGYALYRGRLGGNPRRGLLFEGPPGTGKTHLAKAMARQAGVPFLFVSATSFQSMWYGATARKIRGYFKQLRKAARREGGAIGFIEEIDAIATSRGGMRATSTPASVMGTNACGSSGPTVLVANRFGSSEGTGGVVNELLVQLQSFDTPPLGHRLWNGFAKALNAYLPPRRQVRTRRPVYHNILVIAATNRADDLDPALLRPGRFDRRLTFELPAKADRRELVDYFLAKKSHAPELDGEDLRDQLAGQTFGYTPVMIEHLLDEALVLALKDGRDELAWRDVADARLTGEVGLKNPVTYTDTERRTVATHEAGHATMAYVAGTRRLEVLSIVKRRGSLGLLAHGDLDEVFTRSRTEMYALLHIAMGGMAAEELWFGEAGTGPGGDLAYATQVACEIVGSCGMAGSLVSLEAAQGSLLNDTNLVGRVLADPGMRPEVDRLLAQAKAHARAVLDRNRRLVEALRDALLERDELIGEEITTVLAAAGEPVRDGLVLDRRQPAADRRRTDWLAR
ncbi:MAG TPA: AAA family ATPase [Egibacteraceae bacterium]|nr:AAA family ATPase [Egibacteraceae bacterium]